MSDVTNYQCTGELKVHRIGLNQTGPFVNCPALPWVPRLPADKKKMWKPNLGQFKGSAGGLLESCSLEDECLVLAYLEKCRKISVI